MIPIEGGGVNTLEDKAIQRGFAFFFFTIVCFLKPRTFYTKAIKSTKIVKKLSKARALQKEN